MPSQTFNNLKPEKQDRIRAALLTEFSNHSLADAQVARIVKEAGIARGAFYKYFTDLGDAYTYIYHYALKNIHSVQIQRHQLLTAEEYYRQVQDFVDQIHKGPYYDLIKRHYQTNAPLLSQHKNVVLTSLDDREWGVMVLIHETIKDCLLVPASCQQALIRMKKLLSAILKADD